MYVFGGAKWPSEEIVNELWALDLYTLLWTPLFSPSPLSTEPDNTTMHGNSDTLSVVSFQQNEEDLLPLPVRSHTAHVVGSKMVVLFGLSSGAETCISYVQEYDFGKLLHVLVLYIKGEITIKYLKREKIPSESYCRSLRMPRLEW